MTERRYDPEFAAMIPNLPIHSDWSDMRVAREQMGQLLELALAGQPEPPGVVWEDRMIPGPEGAPEIRVRVYRPESGNRPLPAALYIHGGGFCVGTVEMEHAGAGRAAGNAEAIVVSVDYRLAPEHPFPAGIEDCYAALVWVAENAGELGIDVDHVGVIGGSAGGGLAAGLALMARDRGGPKLCFQVLNIPELDDRLATASMKQFTDTPMWNRPNAITSWRYYLGDMLGGDVSEYAAPARAENLAGLPPAYVSTMEFDPLRDEGILYALRMLEQGVQVELHQYPGTFHGSSMFPNAEVSKRSGDEMMQALRRGLRR